LHLTELAHLINAWQWLPWFDVVYHLPVVQHGATRAVFLLPLLPLLQFREVFISPHHINIVMDYASGGSLFGYVQSRNRLREPLAR
jgi:hypothetical protein